MLQLKILSETGHCLQLPTRIKSLRVDPTVHSIEKFDNKRQCVKAQVNRKLNTITAGGAEISGVHATIAPLKISTQSLPTLEQYQFVPYIDNVAMNQSLEAYRDTLLQYVRYNLKNTTSKLNPDIIQQLEDVAPLTEDQITLLKNTEDNKLYNLFEKIFNVPVNDSFSSNVQNILNSNTTFASDVILSHIHGVIKPTLDVALENSNTNNIKVCELNAATGQLFEKVISELDTQPMLKIDYTVSGQQIDKLNANVIEENNIETVKWDMISSKPAKLSQYDIVMCNYGLNEQENLPAFLTTCKGLMKDRGYFLFIEPTDRLDLVLGLNVLTQDSSNLTDRTKATFCSSEQWKKIVTTAGLEIVCQKSDGVSTMFLCSKQCTATTEDQTVISVEDPEFKWVEDVKKAMAEEKPYGHNIWLTCTSPQKYYNGIIGMVNCLKQESGGDSIR